MFIYKMHRVHFMKMQHVVEQFGCVLELFIAHFADCGSDDIKRIGDNITIELILFLGINQRMRLDIHSNFLFDHQPLFHGRHKLFQS